MAKTDKDLLRAFLGGHVESLGLLASRYQEELYGFLVRFVSDPQAAEDLFQETFLHVWHKRDQYDGRREVRPWLFTIAANLARDHLRRRARRRTVSLDTSVGLDDGEGVSFVDLLPADGDSPIARLEHEEQEEMVKTTLDRLPDHLRAVLVLAYYQRFKYREIAEVLNIPVGTVKSRLHAAVARVLAAWQHVPGLGGEAARPAAE